MFSRKGIRKGIRKDIGKKHSQKAFAKPYGGEDPHRCAEAARIGQCQRRDEYTYVCANSFANNAFANAQLHTLCECLSLFIDMSIYLLTRNQYSKLI